MHARVYKHIHMYPYLTYIHTYTYLATAFIFNVLEKNQKPKNKEHKKENMKKNTQTKDRVLPTPKVCFY